MLLFMVQTPGKFPPGRVDLVDPLVLLLFTVGVAVLVVPLLQLLVPRSRGALRSWRGKRRRARSAANAEVRARALMSELCPHGWRAQLTLFEIGDEELRAAPVGSRARVALDWMELAPESGAAAVTRRVWAPTISEALDAMIADRRTDETLEQIEHGAVADGAWWPDL